MEKQFEDFFIEVIGLLLGLFQCVGFVVMLKYDMFIKYMEFVLVGVQQVFVIIVSEDGSVENCLIEILVGMLFLVFFEVSNFFNVNICGKIFVEVCEDI